MCMTCKTLTILCNLCNLIIRDQILLIRCNWCHNYALWSNFTTIDDQS